ncbi:conserved Plasmodium protein, unknown function [Plasmodium relictum]|uniref:Uncharacterized protein n=1 Tax=Plasmodium relictum TaxID=85471 RepID=A0A1J1H3K2_PLARL|nr:conserved Plasmodium protein, unknown function [Plasmodium relictum]CRG99485.1 conserved Plasmodium protein, unknown function [Plasmodium relictum]
MEEIYENLKIIDYSLICFLNKYRIIHKYIKYLSDIFVNTIYEYNRLINKIILIYKQNIYNAFHNNFINFKENEEKQKEQDKNIIKIKENLKKASKLTKTNIIFKGDIEEDGKNTSEMSTHLKVDLPYNILALYKFRYYRNIFFKNYSTLKKNDNYLNANEQRQKFLNKLKLSAKVNDKEKGKKKSDIFKDDYKNMIRILNENYFFKESQKLKEILIINKYLNKAKNIVNNMPQFLYNIIEEFELTESEFQENMYLFILLALNKWIKKIIFECEHFISYSKLEVYKKKTEENEIYKKYNEYLNEILLRGVEQTIVFNEEKSFFLLPSNLNYNINTSFLTYYFFYINKNLFDFLEGFYNNSIKKTGGINNNEKLKMILLYNRKEESIYMKNDIYNYNLRNEYNEIDNWNNLGFFIEYDYMYPNIFLICNYLLQDETKNIIDIIHKVQGNSYNLLVYQDISIIIQIILFLFKNLKIVFKKEIKEKDEKEENEEKEDEEYEDLRKYISKTNLNHSYSNNYDKLLLPLRLMILNLLKFIHIITKSSNRSFICNFWQKLSINENIGEIDNMYRKEKQEIKENIKEKDEENINNKDITSYDFISLKNHCNQNNCYLFNTKKKIKGEFTACSYRIDINEAIYKRILCYDFYKIVSDHVKKVKFEIENRNNRDMYTGILLKKNKYKIENDQKIKNNSFIKGKSMVMKKKIPQKLEAKYLINEKNSSIKKIMSKIDNKDNVSKDRQKITSNSEKNMNTIILKNKKDTKEIIRNTKYTKVDLEEKNKTYENRKNIIKNSVKPTSLSINGKNPTTTSLKKGIKKVFKVIKQEEKL